ncbi:unnamed protein product [Mytilus coruscus]|uniref:Uncharacterized protein n=1 Tax=Mytilus coruscus TaxID=42192 RepID=A0A6J8A2E1_MYTCO|nr:unnamed protein product [Mytilus coruscus]
MNEICCHLAHLNTTENLFIFGRNIAIDQQMNCNLLPDNKDRSDDTRKIKQRSEEWFSIRKQAKVTGSTLYKAIGLENLSSMRDHFDNVICNLKEAPKNQFTIAAMQHGTDNEINAMSTLVGKILPSLFPDMEFYEEGCGNFLMGLWLFLQMEQLENHLI